MPSSPGWRIFVSTIAMHVCLGHASAAETVLSYAAYAAGFNVLNVDAILDITPTNYRIQVRTRTAGFFGVLVRGDVQTIAAGLRTDAGVSPSRSYTYGTFRGAPRRTQIDYVNGQPVVRILEPALDQERDPVPPTLQRDTIDTESAIVDLIYRASATGKCDSSARIFDGRRLSEIRAVTGGHEVLADRGGEAYSGPALRCDFEGRQLAGFVHDVDATELKRVQRGSAWLAPLRPGEMAIPVKLQFTTRFFGEATMYLTRHN